jgi:hypothetical protein
MTLHAISSAKFPVLVPGQLQLEEPGPQCLAEQHLVVVSSRKNKDQN